MSIIVSAEWAGRLSGASYVIDIAKFLVEQ